MIFENLLAAVFDPQKFLQPANIHLAEQGSHHKLLQLAKTCVLPGLCLRPRRTQGISSVQVAAAAYASNASLRQWCSGLLLGWKLWSGGARC